MGKDSLCVCERWGKGNFKARERGGAWGVRRTWKGDENVGGEGDECKQDGEEEEEA